MLRTEAGADVKRVVRPPALAALEDAGKACTEPGVLPALDAAAVDVRAERERAGARRADPQAVEVRDRRAQARGQRCGRGRRGAGRVPEREERALRCDERGVRPGCDLRGGVVDLVEDNVVWGSACRAKQRQWSIAITSAKCVPTFDLVLVCANVIPDRLFPSQGFLFVNLMLKSTPISCITQLTSLETPPLMMTTPVLLMSFSCLLESPLVTSAKDTFGIICKLEAQQSDKFLLTQTMVMCPHCGIGTTGIYSDAPGNLIRRKPKHNPEAQPQGTFTTIIHAMESVRTSAPFLATSSTASSSSFSIPRQLCTIPSGSLHISFLSAAKRGGRGNASPESPPNTSIIVPSSFIFRSPAGSPSARVLTVPVVVPTAAYLRTKA